MTKRERLKEAFSQLTDRTHLVNGLPPLGRRPDFWARLLSEFMDLLTFAAIYLTTEVHTWPFIAAGALTGIRLLTKIRFQTLWMVTGFLVQIFIFV
jgi:hypothetical protein